MKFPEGRIPLEFSYGSYMSTRLRAAQHRKLAAVFAGKTFEVVEKVDLTGTGKRFHTPLGHYGIRGYLLAEVGNPENTVYLGEVTLASVKAEFDIQ